MTPYGTTCPGCLICQLLRAQQKCLLEAVSFCKRYWCSTMQNTSLNVNFKSGTSWLISCTTRVYVSKSLESSQTMKSRKNNRHCLTHQDDYHKEDSTRKVPCRTEWWLLIRLGSLCSVRYSTSKAGELAQTCCPCRRPGFSFQGWGHNHL